MERRNIFVSLLFLVVFFINNSYSQTTLFSEDFESGTANWTLNGGTGQNQWRVDNQYGPGICSFFGAIPIPNQPVAITNSPQSNYLHITNVPLSGSCPNANYDAGSATNQYAEWTLNLNTTGQTSVSLNFYWLAIGVVGADYGKVEYSINGGGSWTILPTEYSVNGGQWNLETITNAVFDNQANLRFRFQWINSLSNPGALDPPFSIDQISITVPTVIPPSSPSTSVISTTNILCNGATTGAAVTSTTSGTPGYTYQWFSGTVPGTLLSGETDSTLSSVGAGNYYIVVTDNGSLKDTAYINLTQPATALSADTSSTTDILCFGQSNGEVVLLGAGGTGTYTYSLDGTTYVTGATFTALMANTYTGYVKDVNGCVATVGFSITAPSSSVTIDTSNVTNASCIGVNNGSIDLVGSGGTSPYTFSTDGTNFFSNGGSFTGLGANTYTGTIKDDNGCTQTVNFTISNSYALVFDITGTDFIICKGEKGTFNYTQTNVVGAPIFTWTNASSIIMDVSNLSVDVSPNSITTYEGFITDNNGCVSNTESITVSVDNGAIINLSDTLVEINNGDIIEIDANVDEIEVTFNWTPSDGLDVDDEEIVNASPTITTVYIVEATTSNGCSAEGKIKVVVRAELKIVTAFSPNGDNVNETWEIRGIENFVDATVQIINRWGATVYDGTDYKNNEWTGDGYPAASYFYVINLNDGSAELTGSVTIIK